MKVTSDILNKFNSDNKWLNISNIGNEWNIEITGIIGGVTAQDNEYIPYELTKEKANEDLRLVRDISEGNINLRILNSPGGNVNYALAMYELLQISKAKVSTECIGAYNCSAAIPLLMAANVNNRTISENCSILIHPSTNEVEGTIAEIEMSLEFQKITEQKIIDILSKASGKTIEDIIKLMYANGGQGTWISAQDAVTMGFFGGLSKKYKVAANALTNLEAMNFLKLENNKNNNNMENEKSFSLLTEIKNLLIGKKEEKKLAEISVEQFETVQNKVVEIEKQLTAYSLENATLIASATEKDASILEVKNQLDTVVKEFDKFAQMNAHTVKFVDAKLIIDPMGGKKKLSPAAQRVVDALETEKNK